MYWENVWKKLDVFAKGSWFMYLTGSLLFYLSISMTKNISKKEWMLLFGIVGFYGWMANIILFSIFDLMDAGAPTIGGLPDIFMFVIGPSTLAILFLNRYRTSNKFIRVLVFSLVSFLIEYTLGKTGFLKLKKWKPYYSIFFYLALFGIVLPWTFKLIRER